ncbi:MAG: galactokinase [Candidatus Nephthysia bennettiae]|uniref:Galactokinase n=1 Tax=Candidatus Nephthysia bennettiae TaxID=3127016 RepID=A0A934K4Q0_9BACT|nr:galactokinase [Candidatus Dormibacteraeota bacterium]MBJ7613364.1 galactokinase [Candidatus Dormibacteraeota bacterium]PZR85240.1 MAG: galactokinase [Candidatus Dormibacteraeota bacterium]
MSSSPSEWTGRAPGRVNLIGEHIDYLGGPVLPAAVDRYTTVRGRPGPAWKVESAVSGGLTYAEAIGKELGAAPHELEVSSDIPPGMGLSSSAALLVAIAAGLCPEMDGAEAALASQRAEQRATGVQVGVMDQFAAALGQAGHALLLDCSTLRHRPVAFPDDLVIAVLDSGIHRSLADTPYNQRRAEAEAGMPRRRRHVDSEIERVHAFVSALESDDRQRLGTLLKASHVSLRDDFEASTPAVDALVERAWAAPGCLGARQMGGGFGGSVLALLEEGAESRFQEGLGEVPLIFCKTADGAFSAAARERSPR